HRHPPRRRATGRRSHRCAQTGGTLDPVPAHASAEDQPISRGRSRTVVSHEHAATLQFLGAADTVTGSRFLIQNGPTRLLVDCGLFQGYKVLRERNRAPFPVPASTIDAVVLTHAHLDHSGYVPALVRDGFSGHVYATPGPADL